MSVLFRQEGFVELLVTICDGVECFLITPPCRSEALTYIIKKPIILNDW